MSHTTAATSAQPFQSLDMDQETFRKLGHEVVNAIAEYYSTIRERRIISESSSREIEELFGDDLPIDGEDPRDIIEDWEKRILPHATHLGSPRYFGFVNGSGTMMSVFPCKGPQFLQVDL